MDTYISLVKVIFFNIFHLIVFFLFCLSLCSVQSSQTLIVDRIQLDVFHFRTIRPTLSRRTTPLTTQGIWRGQVLWAMMPPSTPTTRRCSRFWEYGRNTNRYWTSMSPPSTSKHLTLSSKCTNECANSNTSSCRYPRKHTT